MLALDRYRNENLVIGTPPDTCTITILDIRNGVVSLGVQAPRDVPVHRGKIHERLRDAERIRDAARAAGG